MQLGPGVAKVEAGSCSSDLNPGPGTSVGHKWTLKKKKKKKRKKKESKCRGLGHCRGVGWIPSLQQWVKGSSGLKA